MRVRTEGGAIQSSKIAVGIILFFASTIVVVLWKQLHTERERSSQQQQRIAQLELQQYESASAQTILPSPSGQPEAGPTGVPSIPGGINGMTLQSIPADARNVMGETQFCAMQKVQMQQQFPREYPDIAEELSLSSSEYEDLKALIIEQRENAPGSPCGTGSRGPVTREALSALQKSQKAELKALLGSKYQQWQEYQSTIAARQRVNSLRLRLANSDFPLTDSQSRSLLTTLNAEEERRNLNLQGRNNAAVTDPRARLEQQEQALRIQEDTNARIIASASGYMSPPQIEALKGPMDTRLRLERSQLQMQRAHLDSGDTTPLPQMEFLEP